MDKNTVVIAIDHGWSNMKTVHETFTSGIREITTEPALFENVLEKGGKYYKVGSERLKVKDSKVKYEKKQYHITIERISVYPQCFAAVASQISEFPAKVLVVDIGSWTVDLMPIIFVGGGATVMKRFGQMQQRNVRYIEDIRANAKGFDYLGKIYLERVIHRAG